MLSAFKIFGMMNLTKQTRKKHAMKTMIYNPTTWSEAADFVEFELLDNQVSGEQRDVLVKPDVNPGLVAWLFGRVADYNSFRAEDEPELLLEGVSMNFNSYNDTLVSFKFA